MIHIYTGNGKGKTTAACGLAVRASGAGKKVCFIQFLKNGTSSEIEQVKKLGIEVMYTASCNKFTSAMNEEELSILRAEHNTLLKHAENLIISNNTDLLVLDEFMAAYNGELLDTIKAEKLIVKAAESRCELVLTGRNAPEKLCCYADYITEMKAVKHPYEKGIHARHGIEY